MALKAYLSFCDVNLYAYIVLKITITVANKKIYKQLKIKRNIQNLPDLTFILHDFLQRPTNVAPLKEIDSIFTIE